MKFLSKAFKLSTFKMFKELKETTPKALKESIKTMFPQIEDISIETEIIKIKQIENPELKTVGFPGGTSGKEPAANSGDIETQCGSLGQEDLLEESVATRCSILAGESHGLRSPSYGP